MPQPVSLDYLKKILAPYQYKLDSSGEFPIFWKRIEQNDTRSKFAFSIVTLTMHSHSLRLEGLNEPRLRNEIKAGKIVLEEEEDIEKYKEVLYETTLDDAGRLEMILTFFEQQIAVIGTQPIYKEEYKTALRNIQLIVEAANQTDMED